MDLLTYLRNYEPQELVHVSGNTYCTEEHDSLRISNGNISRAAEYLGITRFALYRKLEKLGL